MPLVVLRKLRWTTKADNWFAATAVVLATRIHSVPHLKPSPQLNLCFPSNFPKTHNLDHLNTFLSQALPIPISDSNRQGVQIPDSLPSTDIIGTATETIKTSVLNLPQMPMGLSLFRIGVKIALLGDLILLAAPIPTGIDGSLQRNGTTKRILILQTFYPRTVHALFMWKRHCST